MKKKKPRALTEPREPIPLTPEEFDRVTASIGEMDSTLALANDAIARHDERMLAARLAPNGNRTQRRAMRATLRIIQRRSKVLRKRIRTLDELRAQFVRDDEAETKEGTEDEQ